MGTRVAAESDPLAFMGYLIDWHKVEVTRKPGRDWQAAMSAVTTKVNKLVQGRFMVSLAREDEMTDATAFFSVRCEARPDAELVAKHFRASRLFPAPAPRSAPGPAPDWLYKFSAGNT